MCSSRVPASRKTSFIPRSASACPGSISIGSQAFQETPKRHAPAIILALIPQIASWGKGQIDNALGAAGTDAATVGFDKIQASGTYYHGLQVLGGGATLAGIILGAVTVCIIDRHFVKASAFALTGAFLSFFGLIHSEAIGLAQSPTVAAAYLGVAAILFGCAKFAVIAPVDTLEPEMHGLEPAE